MNLTRAVQLANEGYTLKRKKGDRSITGNKGVIYTGDEVFYANYEESRANDWEIVGQKISTNEGQEVPGPTPTVVSNPEEKSAEGELHLDSQTNLEKSKVEDKLASKPEDKQEDKPKNAKTTDIKAPVAKKAAVPKKATGKKINDKIK